MKNCAIVKDNYTGVSRGFAFVEYNSIHVMRTSFENENMFSNFLFIGFGLSLREITNDNTWSRNRWQSCDCSFFEKQFCYFVSIALSLSQQDCLNGISSRLAQIQNEDEDFYNKRSSSSRHRHRHEHDQVRLNFSTDSSFFSLYFIRIVHPMSVNYFHRIMVH